MFDPTPSQLPLQPYSSDSRPLPEIIAAGNPDPENGWAAFPLAYHDVEGARYYAIQDWINGVAQTANPRAFWNALKKRTAKAGIDLSMGCLQLPYRARDRKKYQIEHTDAEGLYRITQRMGVNTGLAQRILDFLAAAGAIVDGQRIEALRPQPEIDEPTVANPDQVLKSVINTYRRMGKPDQWIAARIQSAVGRKRFVEAFQQALRVRPSSFQFAEITDTMRKGLWKRSTQQLRDEIGISSKANLRDHLTMLGLLYESVAEEISSASLNTKTQLEVEQARQIVRSDAEFVGKQAEAAGKRIGIDIPTGKPLLPARSK